MLHTMPQAGAVSAAPKLLPHEGIAAEDARLLARAALARRYELQACAAHLLPGNTALRGCQRWVAFGKDGVTLHSYPALGKGKIAGLQSCSSVWACPVCAAKISTRRCDQELTPALAEAKRKGWTVLMVTWTVRHAKEDKLGALIDALRVCRTHSRNGKAWMRVRARWGIEGSIRALEVTHGAAGWHPHFHELLFCSKPVDRALVLADLRHQWDKGVARAGLASVNDHGVRVSDTYKDVEQYVAKFGRDPKWGVAQEMSRQPVKAAKKASGGLAPFQLLALACDNELVEGKPDPFTAAALFREYCAALAGFRQLYWTPGLKAALGVADLTDAQIEALDEEDAHRQDFGTLTAPEWNCLRTDGRHVRLHSLLAEGDKPGVDALIAPYQRQVAGRALPDGILPARLPFCGPVQPGGVRVDEETGRREVYDAEIRNNEGRRTLTPRLRLEDPYADERDRLPVIGVYRDPLAALVAQDPRDGEALARRLRERNARGEFVLHFAEEAERKALARADLAAWRASWAVSRHHLPSAVLLRLLCLLAVAWEEGPAPAWRDAPLPPLWPALRAESGAAWKEGAAPYSFPSRPDPR